MGVWIEAASQEFSAQVGKFLQVYCICCSTILYVCISDVSPTHRMCSTHAAVSENCSDSAAAEARRAVAMLYHPVMRMKCTAQDDEAKLRTEFI